MSKKPVCVPQIQDKNMSFVEVMQRLCKVKMPEKEGKKKKEKVKKEQKEEKKDKDSF